jgi:hypothetical protein
MRFAMIVAVILAAALPACGGSGGEAPGPERRSAAGEVLGGEVSDAMIPLDQVRSTAPVAEPSSGPAPAASGTGAAKNAEERRPALPQPEVSGGPEPLPAFPGPEDVPPTPQP